MLKLRDPFALSRSEPELVRQERTRNWQTIQSQLRAAVQKYKDAQNDSVSGPTRLDAAYDAVLFCALAVFAAQGYRISSKPGHHMIAIEGLASTLDLSEGEYDELEALRDLRHSKYEGFESIDAQTLKESIQLSKNIMSAVSEWLAKHHSDLIATT
jgi:hypothetical protein